MAAGVRPSEQEHLEGALAAFAQAYVRRVPDGMTATLTDEEVFSELSSVFDLLAIREGHEPLVRVLNPDTDSEGYARTRSVVDVIADDSPFLVDSVRAAIETLGHEITFDVHCVVGTERDEQHRLVDVGSARTSPKRESVQHYVLERELGPEERGEITERIESALRDVRRAVGDFEAMQDAVDRMMHLAREGSSRYGEYEIFEAVEFLRWLKDFNFVFLGYREYAVTEEDGEQWVSVVPGSGLGILSDTNQSKYAKPVPLSSLSDELQERYEEGFLLVVASTNRYSTVHRHARMDYVGIRIMAPDGTVVGEARLLGLFTSRALMDEAASIPILRGKLNDVLEAEDLYEGSHDYRAVVQMFNSFPKADLWSMPVESLRSTFRGLLAMESREHVRLFVSPDLLNRSVTVMVVMPRDRFNAELRRQLQAMFLERFGGQAIDYQLALGEEGDARIHFTVWVEGPIPDVSFDELQHAVVEMSRTWDDRAEEILSPLVDDSAHIVERWSSRLPDYYKASTELSICAGDILQLETLLASGRSLVVGLQNEEEEHGLTRIAFYAQDEALELSQILPVLESLGLRIVEEVPTRINDDDGAILIHDIGVLGPDGAQLDLEACRERVIDGLEAGLTGASEPDSLDRLIVTSRLTHEQVGLLKAYRTYRRRVNPWFTLGYVNDVLSSHPKMAQRLVTLFEARFSPEEVSETTQEVEAEILAALDRVSSLDEDRILRGFLELIMATVRTNAYKPERESLSLKLWSAAVPDMPEPLPLYEVFVYAPHVEGIHLRAGRVARGGIRWSDRREDYRDEVLGLMKAQVTKNSLIVPTGAKGGFVLRSMPADGGVREAVETAYKTFIRGLLDVTDNLVAGEVERPPHVRCHDDEDPYLVVAADRGTATFSDLANSIAAEYEFWLRDAFASGGSVGYDHKALGITARGAWESVKRHFLNMALDPEAHTVTVVGIGDMSGDVFGNGMLQSTNLRLIAAFDHRDIFIDPTPDPARSYEERKRLFAEPRSSWQSYDRSLISAGGGVWSRQAKSIKLSDEVQEALGTEASALTPDELIQTILKAPVDLLWNGGIGTYVKASSESHGDCSDRSNDAVRIDAADLRCQVVGEGGNLGLTQLARIEYAMNGGRINTDFIDNSGGVDCSDREVNLKILLSLAEDRGDLSPDDRVALISEATDDVTVRVLDDSHNQALILSQDEERSATVLESYEDLMKTLERHGLLSRHLEGLPTSDEIIERTRDETGMTRPELAVLLSYAKQDLTRQLLESDVPDMAEMLPDLAGYFPEAVSERFGDLLWDHPLRREILATVLASRVLDDEGITFVNRMVLETGATRANVVPAYRVARRMVDADRRWSEVDSLGADVEPAVGREMLDAIDWLVESTTQWFLSAPGDLPATDELERWRTAFAKLETWMTNSDLDVLSSQRGDQVDELVAMGVPESLGIRHVHHDELVHGPNIIDVAFDVGREVEEVAELFIRIGERYRLDWLKLQTEKLGTKTRWNRWAIRSLEGDLVTLRRDIARSVLETGSELEPEAALDAHAAARRERHNRLDQFMQLLAQEGSDQLDALLVAARQIRALAS